VQALTGAPYPHVQYGKPTKATYDFAEKMLRAHMSELHGVPAGSDIQPRLLVGDFSLSPYPILNEALNVLRTQLHDRG
jgi:ribonucleotide monophosphatase NagD (HAD superfamily)